MTKQTNQDIKKAKHIGISKLFSLRGIETNMFSCGSCGNIFNADKKIQNRIIVCPSCREKIQIKMEKKNNE